MAQWFAFEVRRVYAVLGESDDDRKRRQLVELIQRKGGEATARELRQSDRRFRHSTESAEEALNELEKAGRGRWVPIPSDSKGGRPTRVFRLDRSVYVYETHAISEENQGSVDVDNVDSPDFDPDEEAEWTG